jgi:hypothetical protein
LEIVVRVKGGWWLKWWEHLIRWSRRLFCGPWRVYVVVQVLEIEELFDVVLGVATLDIGGSKGSFLKMLERRESIRTKNIR